MPALGDILDAKKEDLPAFYVLFNTELGLRGVKVGADLDEKSVSVDLFDLYIELEKGKAHKEAIEHYIKFQDEELKLYEDAKAEYDADTSEDKRPWRSEPPYIYTEEAQKEVMAEIDKDLAEYESKIKEEIQKL